MIVLLASLALGGDPSIKPWPIGPVSAYRPAAGRSVAEPVCPGRLGFAVHLELFSNRRAVVIPAGIGRCSDPARTRTPTGVFEVARSGLVLGDLFRIWGQPLATHRLLTFRSGSAVRAYVNGRAVGGSVSSIPLRPGAEIVVEIGGYVPPHASFLFPKRLS